jgi:class 3 adenylate cyclase
VLGRGVNIAARLEQRCQQGDILVSEPIFQQLAPRPGGAREMGALELKGIPEPVYCYARSSAFSRTYSLKRATLGMRGSIDGSD